MDPRAWRMVDFGPEEAKVTFEMGEEPSDEEVAAMVKKLDLKEEQKPDESDS